MPGIPHLSGAQVISGNEARGAGAESNAAAGGLRSLNTAVPADAVRAPREARPGRNAADPEKRQATEERFAAIDQARRGFADARTGDFVRLSRRDGDQAREPDLFGGLAAQLRGAQPFR